MKYSEKEKRLWNTPQCKDREEKGYLVQRALHKLK